MLPASSGTPHLLLLLYAGCFLLSLPLDAPHHVAADTSSPFSFSFNFSNPSSYSSEDLNFEGDATVHGGLADLTCDTLAGSIRNCSGRMSYRRPVPFYDNTTGVVASFATRFTFTIRIPEGGRKGDGMAFFLADYPSAMPPGSEGGGLGLIVRNRSIAYGPDRFIAVEFDTYNNSFDPQKSWDHIGIDLSSVTSVNTTSLPSFSLQGTMTASINFTSSTRVMVATLHFDDHPSRPPVEVGTQLPDPVTSLLPPEVAVGFSASTGASVELHQILSWSFSSTLAPNPKKQIGHGMIVAAITGGAVVFLVVVWFILSWFMWKLRRDSLVAGAGPRQYRYRDLANATDNFSEERKLGEGAFGGVYKGTSLKNHDGQQQQVAVKKIFKGSRGGTKDFLAEVNTVSKTKHKNLVMLEGWCCRSGSSWNLIDFMCWCNQKQDDKLFLVYELVPNGNLDEHLHKRPDTILPWPIRYKIVKGIGSALVYLHHECEPYILHRDIKPSNILLDDDYNPKLADFGLSRIANHNNATLLTTAVGTVGYMDPQCMKDGEVRFNCSSDVYSFGIVLLEIASRKSREQLWDLYRRSSSSSAVLMVEDGADERLRGEFDRGQMEHVLVVGLWCSLPDAAQRPSLRQAMRVLEHYAPLPDLASSATGSST